jgi:myo-inositol-1(or 4)-monophosphatase
MKILKHFIPVIKEHLNLVLELRFEKEKKSDDSFVSKGDLLMDQLVTNFVAVNYDDYLIVSEESGKHQIINNDISSYIIIVDPIDGTENFVSGLREWGVGISVYKDNKHVESLIALPELDEYILTGDQIQRFESRIAGLSSSLSKQQLMQLDEGYEYRIIGCCMYNMLQVVKGSFATFQNPKGANSWDILPGLNLALENNLEVIVENKKYNGEFLQPTQKYRFSIRNV